MEVKDNEEGKGRLRKKAQGMNFSSRKLKKGIRRRTYCMKSRDDSESRGRQAR